MCRELAKLGMDAARKASQAIDREWAARPQTPPEPQPTRHPALQPRPATACGAPRQETASPTLALARITRAVQQILAFETRIAAEEKVRREEEASRVSFRAALREEAASRARSKTPPPGPAAPIRPAEPEFPSLLANISKELGIDLEDRSVASRLPSFQKTTDPP